MQDETSAQELQERLSLIQSMIAEGRRSTESWGWTFVLWGLAYGVAIVLSSWGGPLSVWGNRYVITGNVGSEIVWPITMVCAVLLTLAIGFRKGRPKTGTTLVRAVVSVWVSAGISMLVIFPSLAFAGKLDEHVFVAVVAAMLGVANGASGMILRWKAQIACGVIWWITSAAACFGTEAQLTIAFLVAIFLCQIVFGIYAMMMESRRRQREIAHA